MMQALNPDLPVRPPDNAFELSLQWLNGTHVGVPTDDTRILEFWLSSAADEAELDLCLSTSLLSSVRCLAEIRHLTSDDQISESNRGLQEWESGVSRLTDRMSAQCTDWCDALGEFCERGDRMLIALLGIALEQACTLIPISSAVKQIADKVCRQSRRWCETIPVPPAPLRSAVSADYVCCGRNKNLYSTLQSLAALLKGREDDFLIQLVSSMDSSAATTHFDEDDLVIACEELSSTLDHLLSGWPIELSRLDGPLRLLQQHLPTSSEKSVAATGDVLILRQAFRELEAFTTASRNAPAGSTLPEAHSAHKQPEALTLLTEIFHWVMTRNVAFSDRYSAAFDSLITDGKFDAAHVSLPLLDLLISLNSELCTPATGQEHLRTLRDRIHRILETLGFVVLHETLIGKAISAFRNHITIFRAHPTTSMPSGHIISVRQPGYLQTTTDGGLSLVRPAEVIISR